MERDIKTYLRLRFSYYLVTTHRRNLISLVVTFLCWTEAVNDERELALESVGIQDEQRH
jgi:hypothetical protein